MAEPSVPRALRSENQSACCALFRMPKKTALPRKPPRTMSTTSPKAVHRNLPVKLPMATQPPDNGRGVPQPMTSRMNVSGPREPMHSDKAHCAKARASALAKQRDELRKGHPARRVEAP